MLRLLNWKLRESSKDNKELINVSLPTQRVKPHLNVIFLSEVFQLLYVFRTSILKVSLMNLLDHLVSSVVYGTSGVLWMTKLSLKWKLLASQPLNSLGSTTTRRSRKARTWRSSTHLKTVVNSNSLLLHWLNLEVMLWKLEMFMD